MRSTKPVTNQLLRPQAVSTVLTVSQLTGQIKDIIETSFDYFHVTGEISNAKLYPSGHWYFSLKDQEATLPCVCFRQTSNQIRFQLEDGLSVVAKGKLSIYPPRGAYQMIVSAIEPVGIGEWQLAFEQLKEKLEKEGSLSPERKRPIPILPGKIGIVTSQAGAAIQDILNTLRRRNKSVNVVISPAKVQGEGSPQSVADALYLLKVIEDLDVIIVARGGGSIEDLWSFNTEVVARAVLDCNVPVISGVGHETDVTICDLVADLRAPTPTAAAELVSRGYGELNDKWSYLTSRLLTRMEDKLSRAQRKLGQLSPEKSLLRYKERLRLLQANVLFCRQGLKSKVEHRLSLAQHRLDQLTDKLSALGPQNVLGRGFAILRKEDGSLVRDFQKVVPGERIEALLESGRLIIEVKEAKESWW